MARTYESLHSSLFSGTSLKSRNVKTSRKKELIEHLQQAGAFTAKHAATYIAQILNISRATVYNYLSDH
ncbi:helix-turn-helix domain-containing protein [Legionella tunisiensis]|uniref:helix-turn-helix domain-containing protein n=1 Tax=Legionella tunisiensis TaxID=1034944 RepID=UPI0009FBEBE0